MITLLRSRVFGHAALALLIAVLAGCSVSALPGEARESDVSESPIATEASPDASPSGTEPSPSQSSEPSMSPPPAASPGSEVTPTPEPEPTRLPEPTPSPPPSPTPTGSSSDAPSPSATPTPSPFGTISGIGHLDGRPFTIDVWIDHEGGAHGLFDGSVVGASGPLHVTGPVTCAWIEGNIGVLGGRADWTDFVVMVSDRPNGMIIGTGRPGCDITGFGDPASSPTTDGDIHVIPEP
jgi:hypothetical protein